MYIIVINFEIKESEKVSIRLPVHESYVYSSMQNTNVYSL